MNPDQCEIRFNTIRGFHYRLQSTTDLGLPFLDEPEASMRATETTTVRLAAADHASRFYRVLLSPLP